MQRIVQPEILDNLPPADPRAAGSRGDLRRINFIMGNDRVLTDALCRNRASVADGSRPLRLVEVGAGDGSLLLRMARHWSALGVTADATLLDRQDLVSAATRRGFAALGWSAECVTTDIFGWLGQASPPVDVILANLFLHHFPDPLLTDLLRLAAAKTRLFIACEPRRSEVALMAARLLGLIGCNGVTRHDAVVSVRAGFSAHELTSLWPEDSAWQTSELAAGWFSHCFIAIKS
jgi:hypothetical protein